MANFIATMNHMDGQETSLFEMSLSRQHHRKIHRLLDTYPRPIGRYMRNLSDDLFQDLYHRVEEFIFIKDRIDPSGNVLLGRKKDRKMEVDQFVAKLIRAMRNTHHGYHLNESPMELLVLSDGYIGKALQLIIPMNVFMLLSDIQVFLEQW